MKKYTVTFPVTGQVVYRGIKANSEEEAIEVAKNIEEAINTEWEADVFNADVKEEDE